MNIYYCLYVRQLQTTLSDTLHGVSMISLSLFLSPGLRARPRGRRPIAGGTHGITRGRLGYTFAPCAVSFSRSCSGAMRESACMYASPAPDFVQRRWICTEQKHAGSSWAFKESCFNMSTSGVRSLSPPSFSLRATFSLDFVSFGSKQPEDPVSHWY